MIRLVQCITNPEQTMQISASWFLQILGPKLPIPVILGGGGSSLYHSLPDPEQEMSEIK